MGGGRDTWIPQGEGNRIDFIAELRAEMRMGESGGKEGMRREILN